MRVFNKMIAKVCVYVFKYGCSSTPKMFLPPCY